MTKEIYEARRNLEAALQAYVRLLRPQLKNMYVQDYVMIVASEAMDPGHENITYMNAVNRENMAQYAVKGLLHSGLESYTRSFNNE